jgi:hypothetical protein
MTETQTATQGIGTGGQGVVGRKVARVPSFDARYTIVKATPSSGGWTYTLRTVLGQEQDVDGQDARFRLLAVEAEASVRTDDLADLDDFIREKLADVPAGSMDTWADDPPTAAKDVSMGSGYKMANAAASAQFILWSGGAADCLIIAATGATNSYITHQDRGGIGEKGAPSRDDIIQQIRSLKAPVRIWLASAMFGKFRETGIMQSELILSAVAMLKAEPGCTIVAIFSELSLALNTKTGAVLAGKAVQDGLDPFNPNPVSKRFLTDAVNTVPSGTILISPRVGWQRNAALIRADRPDTGKPVRLGKVVFTGKAGHDQWELFTCRKTPQGTWIYDPVALAAGTAVEALTQMYISYLRAHPEFAQT